jgi:hypothetical protein
MVIRPSTTASWLNSSLIVALFFPHVSKTSAVTRKRIFLWSS